MDNCFTKQKRLLSFVRVVTVTLPRSFYSTTQDLVTAVAGLRSAGKQKMQPGWLRKLG